MLEIDRLAELQRMEQAARAALGGLAATAESDGDEDRERTLDEALAGR